MAYTSWSLVRQALSMAMPPRGPTASRHCRASSSRGRIPAEKTTMSASRCDPSANTMRWRARAPSVICCVLRPVCTCTPRRSIWACSTRPPPSSTCTAIRRGANSTTWVSRPMSRRALAHSSPSRPPPITTPERALAPAACMASRSSMVRYTKQCGRSRPGTWGTKGLEPVASTSLSYGTTSPSCVVTVLVRRSMLAARVASRSEKPVRSKKPGSTSDSSAADLPLKNSER